MSNVMKRLTNAPVNQLTYGTKQQKLASAVIIMLGWEGLVSAKLNALEMTTKA